MKPTKVVLLGKFCNLSHCINCRRTNLVDQMIYMLERHSTHLEELVQERTKQLTDEQKKTDELLSRMLPKFVNKIMINTG